MRGLTREEYEQALAAFPRIDWALIACHLKDMLRVVISIKAGKIAPSTILRRLGRALEAAAHRVGRADIGHDAANTIVPFGLARSFSG